MSIPTSASLLFDNLSAEANSICFRRLASPVRGANSHSIIPAAIQTGDHPIHGHAYEELFDLLLRQY